MLAERSVYRAVHYEVQYCIFEFVKCIRNEIEWNGIYEFMVDRPYTHLKGKKEQNSIICSDETHKDINDFFWLFRVFIKKASI